MSAPGVGVPFFDANSSLLRSDLVLEGLALALDLLRLGCLQVRPVGYPSGYRI